MKWGPAETPICGELNTSKWSQIPFWNYQVGQKHIQCFFLGKKLQACSYLFRDRYCFGNINIVNHPIQPSSLWCSSPCPCRGNIKPSSMSASHHGFRLVNGAKLHAEGWNLSYTRCWSHALQHCAALGTSQMIRKAPKGRITKTVTKVQYIFIVIIDVWQKIGMSA